MLCFLYYFPRGIARRAPEFQNVPAHLIGELEHAGDDRVGGVLRATAEHQTPQAQHVFAGLFSIRGPRAAGRADVSDELRTSGPVSICPATTGVGASQTSDRFFGRLASLGVLPGLEAGDA